MCFNDKGYNIYIWPTFFLLNITFSAICGVFIQCIQLGIFFKPARKSERYTLTETLIWWRQCDPFNILTHCLEMNEALLPVTGLGLPYYYQNKRAPNVIWNKGKVWHQSDLAAVPTKQNAAGVEPRGTWLTYSLSWGQRKQQSWMTTPWERSALEARDLSLEL